MKFLLILSLTVSLLVIYSSGHENAFLMSLSRLPRKQNYESCPDGKTLCKSGYSCGCETSICKRMDSSPEPEPGPGPVVENGKTPRPSQGRAVDTLIDRVVYDQIINKPVDYGSVILDCPTVRNITQRNVISAENRRWYKDNDGTWFVPIVMDPAFTTDEKNTIYAGMVNIQDNTCMRFYIYTENQLAGADYVNIQRGSGKGCFSNSIGRARVGKQIINLQPIEKGSGCIFPGTAAHELLHAIGFDHQQNTPGRDEYVTIMFQNIIERYKPNFYEDSASEYTAFGSPYDYGSVMHYSADAFTNNGQKTIVVKQAGAKIGQRDGLSRWDAYKVQKMHSCS